MTKNNQTKMREQHLSGIMTNYTTSVPWLGAMLKNYTQLKMYLHCRSPISLCYGKQKCWNWRAGRPHQRQPRSVQWYKRRSKTNGLRKWIGQPCAGTTSIYSHKLRPHRTGLVLNTHWCTTESKLSLVRKILYCTGHIRESESGCSKEK